MQRALRAHLRTGVGLSLSHISHSGRLTLTAALLHSFWITTAPTSPAAAMVAEESDSVEGGNAVTRWKGVERMSGREL